MAKTKPRQELDGQKWTLAAIKCRLLSVQLLHEIVVSLLLTFLRYLVVFLKEHGSETYGDLCASYVDTMNKVNLYDALVSFSMTKSV